VSASSTRCEKTSPPQRIEIALHALAIDHELLDDRRHAAEREVERHGRIGRDVALDRRVRDVALVPQRDVLQRRNDGAAYHAGETSEVLGQHRVALVRHRGAALLPLGEEFLGLAHFRALQVADLGGQVLQGRGHDGERCEERGVPVARDDLRGDRLDRKPELAGDVLLDPGIDIGKGAHRPRDGAGRDLGARCHQPGAVTVEAA